jgi:hypothetical protein
MALSAWCVVVSTALGVLAGAAAAAAERRKPAKPQPVSGVKLDKTPFKGRVIAYDDEGFELLVKEGVTSEVAWDEVDARSRYVVWKNLIDRKDAAAHVELGRKLLAVEGGRDWAEKAFATAVQLDAKLKPAVEEIRKNPPAVESASRDDGGEGGTGKRGKTAKAGEGEGEDGAGGEMAEAERAGPQIVGGMDARFWEPQTEGQQAAAVAELKRFAAATQSQMKKELRLSETTFFLFYSDLPDQEARNWAGLLDRMYAKLTGLFAVPSADNIWRGKALVFVFRAESDYLRFQALMHKTDAQGTRGMCHGYGNGIVHIAFVRQADELEFAHVLVHESVHGFLHRYESPARIPSWANEGLAEWIASELVPRPNRRKEVRNIAKTFLLRNQGVAALFEAEHIEAWQYPVAEMLTTFMIERNKSGYVGFIKAVKDGTAWEEALNAAFKSREKLLQEFGKGIGV